MDQHIETGTTMVAKAAAPIAVVVAGLAGMHITDFVQIATLVYVCLMAGQKAWHIYKEWKAGKEAKMLDE